MLQVLRDSTNWLRNIEWCGAMAGLKKCTRIWEGLIATLSDASGMYFLFPHQCLVHLPQSDESYIKTEKHRSYILCYQLQLITSPCKHRRKLCHRFTCNCLCSKRFNVINIDGFRCIYDDLIESLCMASYILRNVTYGGIWGISTRMKCLYSYLKLSYWTPPQRHSYLSTRHLESHVVRKYLPRKEITCWATSSTIW